MSFIGCKLGSNKIDHKSKGRRKSDFMAGLKLEYDRYRTEILPLYPSDKEQAENADSYEKFDIAKEDFLEALWDVISQYFDDNGDKKNAV
jgi:hypothetical protein